MTNRKSVRFLVRAGCFVILLQAIGVGGVALAASPVEAQPYYRAGIEYLNQAQYEQAVRYISFALDLDPSLPEGWTRLGYAQEYLGQNDAAIKSYRKALDAKPTDTYAQARLEILDQQKAEDMDPRAGSAIQGDITSPVLSSPIEVSNTASSKKELRWKVSIHGGIRHDLSKFFPAMRQYLETWSQEVYPGQFISREAGGTKEALFGNLGLEWRLRGWCFLGLSLGYTLNSSPAWASLRNVYDLGSTTQTDTLTREYKDYKIVPIDLSAKGEFRRGRWTFFGGIFGGPRIASFRYFDEWLTEFVGFTNASVAEKIEAQVQGVGIGYGISSEIEYSLGRHLRLSLAVQISGGFAHMRGTYEGTTTTTGDFSDAIYVDKGNVVLLAGPSPSTGAPYFLSPPDSADAASHSLAKFGLSSLNMSLGFSYAF